jgi:hypothetical protein
MIRPYEILLRSEAIDSLRGMRATPRRQVTAFIDSLALEPFSEGNYTVKDASGRGIQINVLGQ